MSLKVLGLTALLATVSIAAMAQGGQDVNTICTDNADANVAAVAAARAALPDAVAAKAALAAQADIEGNSACIGAMLTASTDTVLVNALAELVLANQDSENPAGGTDGATNSDFAPQTGGTSENSNQFTRQTTGTPASPIVPSL